MADTEKKKSFLRDLAASFKKGFQPKGKRFEAESKRSATKVGFIGSKDPATQAKLMRIRKKKAAAKKVAAKKAAESN